MEGLGVRLTAVTFSGAFPVLERSTLPTGIVVPFGVGLGACNGMKAVLVVSSTPGTAVGAVVKTYAAPWAVLPLIA